MFDQNLIPLIVIVTYALAEIAKNTVMTTDKRKKVIPAICILFGAAFGALLFRVSPESFSEGMTIVQAAVEGAISGAAATGCNQLLKQLLKGNVNNEEDATLSGEDNS